MYGEPEDVEGECNARLFIADVHGDGHATMRCQLKPDHTGPHQEVYNAGSEEFPNRVTVIWEQDETIMCEKHGRQRMNEPDPDMPDLPACEACESEYWDAKDKEEDDAGGCTDS